MAFSVTQHHLNSAETANTEKDSVIWTGKLVAQTDNWPIFRRLLLALKESDTHWVFTFKSSLHTHFVPCANYRQVFLDWLSTIWIKSMDNLSWAEWIWNHSDLNVSHVSHAADRTQLLLLFVLLRTFGYLKRDSAVAGRGLREWHHHWSFRCWQAWKEKHCPPGHKTLRPK